jgi:Lecithin retinol acyltransferase
MPENLPPGTHLSTPRLGYLHHGLYAGEGRVLHYGGLHRYAWRRPVEEVSLAQFASGRGFAVVANAGARFSGTAAVARARSRLGEDRYHLWSNNCEHFVTWCLTGSAHSEQVQAVRERLRAVPAWLAGLPRALQLQPRHRAVQAS